MGAAQYALGRRCDDAANCVERSEVSMGSSVMHEGRTSALERNGEGGGSGQEHGQ